MALPNKSVARVWFPQSGVMHNVELNPVTRRILAECYHAGDQGHWIAGHRSAADALGPWIVREAA